MIRNDIFMRIEQFFLIASIFTCAGLKAWSQESRSQSKALTSVTEATVKIICNNGARTGSGSVIGLTEGGRTLILTTTEVVSSNYAEADPDTPLEFYDTIEAKLSNLPDPVPVRVLVEFVDRSKDLALVGTRVPAPSARLMSYAGASKITPGQAVVTYGYSEVNRLSLTQSSVLSVTEKYLVLDVRWDAASSGGPIVDDEGRMVGLATALTTGPEDQRGYAIRIGVVSSVVNGWLNTLTGLKASWQRESKGFPTGWVIGGIFAASGGTAAALLISGGGDDGFPKPPLRPEGN